MRLIFGFLALVALLFAAGPGFRSQKQWSEHYVKHGGEFGKITKQEYLEKAQRLRDAPLSQSILEAIRKDKVITRFDRKQGYFGAYNPDRSIRTFFVPNDGERYFRRQAERP